MALREWFNQLRDRAELIILAYGLWPLVTLTFSALASTWYFAAFRIQADWLWKTKHFWLPDIALFIIIITVAIFWLRSHYYRNLEFRILKSEVSIMRCSNIAYEYRNKKTIKPMRDGKIRVPFSMCWSGTDQDFVVSIHGYENTLITKQPKIFGPSRIKSTGNGWMFLVELEGKFRKGDTIWVEVVTTAKDTKNELEDFIGLRTPPYRIKEVKLSLAVLGGIKLPEQIVFCRKVNGHPEQVEFDQQGWVKEYRHHHVTFTKKNPRPNCQYLLRWFYEDEARHPVSANSGIIIEKPQAPLPDLLEALTKSGMPRIRRAL